MIISEKFNAQVNAQIGHELGNSHQYLAIAAHFEAEALFGLAKIYYTQADEEREHAMKLLKFLLDSGGKVAIPAVSEPLATFTSAEHAVQFAYDLEIKTTEQIYGLMSLATDEKNYIASSFLKWFVDEQLEEISTAQDRLEIVRKAGMNVMMVEAYIAHNAG